MSLPPGYELRAPQSGEVEAVAEVVEASDLDANGRSVLGADFLRDSWSRAGFDLAADAWIVLDDRGDVVGYAAAMLEEPDVVEAWGVVHPRHRGRGIGSAFLDLTQERASELLADAGEARFRHAINATDEEAAAMLRARGFEVVRHFWHMEIDPLEASEPAPDPAGVEISGVEDPGDFEAVHEIMDEAFADDWGYHPQPFDEWMDEHTRSPSYDPSLWLLARAAGQPAGALTATGGDDRGWVTELGVRARHRGRGIAAALLARSFATFARRGTRRVILNVDAENPTGATALYERVGMEVVGRWDLWERLIPASGDVKPSNEVGP